MGRILEKVIEMLHKLKTIRKISPNSNVKTVYVMVVANILINEPQLIYIEVFGWSSG